jgi:small subunit ribosomal protein S21
MGLPRVGENPPVVFVSTRNVPTDPGPQDLAWMKQNERIRMIKVKSRGNETAEQMLRRFKKMCEKEGLTKDIKRVAYYEKPSEKRRRRARKTPRLAGGRR